MTRLPTVSVLRYYSGSSQEAVKRHYMRWRNERGIPLRCDNEECPLYDKPVWNGKNLTLILDHRNGVNVDNRPENLRFLCPNCDSQLPTKGGGNKGRVVAKSGSYVRTSRDGKREINIFPSPGVFKLTGSPATLTVTRASGLVEER